MRHADEPIRPVLADGAETAAWVLDFLLENPDLHNQECFELDEMDEEDDACFTTRCIAGWVNWLHGDCQIGCWSCAMKHLQIDYETGSMLFFRTSDEEAIEALRYLARGEPVDWEADTFTF